MSDQTCAENLSWDLGSGILDYTSYQTYVENHGGNLITHTPKTTKQGKNT